MATLDADTVELFSSHGTATVSDALDLAGVGGAVWGPHRLSGHGTVAGPAFTVDFEPVDDGEPAPAADFLDDVPRGAVVVLANSGRPCTVWGDILTEVARARGVAGTVIDGHCRDVDRIRELGYSVWARGAFMRSGKNRVRMRAVQQPVVVGAGTEALTVGPGDLVCADGSGVVVVPVARTEEIAAGVRRVVAVEEAVLREVRAGRRLRDARAAHGYDRVARRLDRGAGT